MVYAWELEALKNWTVSQIRNRIWMAVDSGQPVPGCISVEALRKELLNRGLEPVGYHNT